MKKIKYYYNTNTLRYEKLVTPLRVKLLRFFGFIAAAFVTAFILVSLAFRFIPSPQAKLAEARYEKMKQNYDVLVAQATMLEEKMASLEKRDNQVYRSTFCSSFFCSVSLARALSGKGLASKIER